MLENVKSGASQHRLDTRAIWNPPVCWIACVAMLNETHFRKLIPLENPLLPKWIITRQTVCLLASPLHGLKNKQIARDVLVNQIEGQQRMSQVVKHAHEKHDVELLPEFR